VHIDIITLFPGMLKSFFEESIIKRAQQKGLAEIELHDLRKFALPSDTRKTVDDYAFGGGAGMVIMIEPVVRCLEYLREKDKPDEIIYLTPDGEHFIQSTANELSLQKRIVLLCGRYKGIDQRIRDHFITREISIGDYVISGGELAAAVVADAVIRLIPGVLSDETSALSDSYQDGILDSPVYTRPENFRDMKVPDVLLSGDHKRIEEWRYQKALEKTKKRRPGLFDKL
jgi:tRNA (guanine37-N1)-methyltransferase